ncbi:MAG: DUF2214 family protein [Betaproteobacteria bacterium]
MLDFSLAVVHHLVVFSLLAIVVALAAGLVRAVYAAKGWYFYSNNGFFWAKIAIFVVIGLLSVPPTLKFIQWRKMQHVPQDAQVDAVRVYLWAELALFALLPLCAAGMARGYWQLV